MRKAITILALGTIVVGTFFAGAALQASPSSGFDRLKVLVGEWQTKSPKGELSLDKIELVSNGNSLLETSQNSEANQMVTLYSPDGNRVVVTHYCSAGNQPRMETAPTTGDQKEFEFSFKDITNLASAESGHMHHLVIKIDDNDHFSEQWTWREGGKDRTETFLFTRKKP
jgi:hypothetical protein